jgi:hypothetical protein
MDERIRAVVAALAPTHSLDLLLEGHSVSLYGATIPARRRMLFYSGSLETLCAFYLALAVVGLTTNIYGTSTKLEMRRIADGMLRNDIFNGMIKRKNKTLVGLKTGGEIRFRPKSYHGCRGDTCDVLCHVDTVCPTFYCHIPEDIFKANQGMAFTIVKPRDTYWFYRVLDKYIDTSIII